GKVVEQERVRLADGAAEDVRVPRRRIAPQAQVPLSVREEVTLDLAGRDPGQRRDPRAQLRIGRRRVDHAPRSSRIIRVRRSCRFGSSPTGYWCGLTNR